MESRSRKLIIDRESWDELLETAFGSDPKLADSLAHLLFSLKEAIQSGPEGCIAAVEALQCGIERVYAYTDAHKLAFELYASYLTGKLKPWDEPYQLITGALERFNDPKLPRKRSNSR